MMKPLYFPFTYISDTSAADLCACFRQITVYQPGISNLSGTMQKLSQKGLIDIRIPVSGDNEKLNALLNEYKTWGELHQKSAMSFLKATEDKIPFFEETFSSQIASQIKKNMAGTKLEPETDFVFNSRLFLCLAQEYDQQQDVIMQHLASVSEMEKKLLYNLTDEDENLLGKNTLPSLKTDYDLEKYKIKERVNAWMCLAINDKEKPEFFITDSKDAFDFIMEANPDSEKVIDLHSIPVCPDPDITEKLQIMLAGQVERSLSDGNFKESGKIDVIPAACKSEREISLKIFRVCNKPRYEFFQNLLIRNIDIAKNIGNVNETDKCILIGFVENHNIAS